MFTAAMPFSMLYPSLEERIGRNTRLSLTKALRKWSVPEAIWPTGENGGAEQIEASLAVIHHGVSVVEALCVALLRVTNGILHKARIRAVYHCKIKTARCLMSDREARVRKDRRNQWRRLNSRIAAAASGAISINYKPQTTLSFWRYGL